MTVREKMVYIRERRGLSKKQMAGYCGVSETLLGMVEGWAVTHPNAVRRIQVAYGLNNLEAEELLPMNRRPHGGDYDPDRFVPRDYEYMRGQDKREERQ